MYIYIFFSTDQNTVKATKPYILLKPEHIQDIFKPQSNALNLITFYQLFYLITSQTTIQLLENMKYKSNLNIPFSNDGQKTRWLMLSFN